LGVASAHILHKRIQQKESWLGLVIIVTQNIMNFMSHFISCLLLLLPSIQTWEEGTYSCVIDSVLPAHTVGFFLNGSRFFLNGLKVFSQWWVVQVFAE
jgi:ABC-type enterochelin transport system permease subunit